MNRFSSGVLCTPLQEIVKFTNFRDLSKIYFPFKRKKVFLFLRSAKCPRMLERNKSKLVENFVLILYKNKKKKNRKINENWKM